MHRRSHHVAGPAAHQHRVHAGVPRRDGRLRRHGCLLYTSRESFTAAVRAVAEKNTRARMALLQVAQSECLLPTEEEIDKTLSERAERTKKTLEEIKAATNVEAMRRNEGIRRAADYVIEHSTIEEK